MQIDFVKLGTEIVVIASVAHALLPPWEMLSEFPASQRYYRLFIYLVGWVALNWRTTIYKSLSTAEGTKPSKVANGHTP